MRSFWIPRRSMRRPFSGRRSSSCTRHCGGRDASPVGAEDGRGAGLRPRRRWRYSGKPPIRAKGAVVLGVSDPRRILSAFIAAVLIVMAALDGAASSDPFAPTPGSPLAVMDDDGGDLEAEAGATFRNLLGWCLDGAATPPGLDHLCPAPEPASRRLAATQPRAVH